jgi:hypothetical protein
MVDGGSEYGEMIAGHYKSLNIVKWCQSNTNGDQSYGETVALKIQGLTGNWSFSCRMLKSSLYVHVLPT